MQGLKPDFTVSLEMCPLTKLQFHEPYLKIFLAKFGLWVFFPFVIFSSPKEVMERSPKDLREFKMKLLSALFCAQCCILYLDDLGIQQKG